MTKAIYIFFLVPIPNQAVVKKRQTRIYSDWAQSTGRNKWLKQSTEEKKWGKLRNVV